MSIFGKLFKKENERETYNSASLQFDEGLFGPEDPYEKPASWFFGEEGRRSLQYYLNLYEDPIKSGQVKRMIREKDYSALFNIIILKRRNCYMSFLDRYLASLRRDRSNSLEYGEKGWCYFLNHFCDSFFSQIKSGKDIKDVLSADKNPFLKFFVRFNFPETPKRFQQPMYQSPLNKRKSDYIVLATAYISDAYEYGVDVSDEEWLYSDTTFFSKDGTAFYESADMAFLMQLYAEKKTYLPGGLDALAATASLYNKEKIENDLF